MEEFIPYCKQYIYDHIDDYRGQKMYMSDLGYTLTEGPNANGTLTYSQQLAIEYLREWWYDASTFFEYLKDNLGMSMNPFANPEAYMVAMVVEGVRSLIDRALGYIEFDQEMEVLDGELIEHIVKKVSEDDSEELF